MDRQEFVDTLYELVSLNEWVWKVLSSDRLSWAEKHETVISRWCSVGFHEHMNKIGWRSPERPEIQSGTHEEWVREFARFTGRVSDRARATLEALGYKVSVNGGPGW
jgi:hypothetical protein